MTTRFRLDPELAAITVMIPKLDLQDVVSARQLEERLIDDGREPTPGVDHIDHQVSRPDGTSIAVRIYRPSGLAGALPALLYIHGGAFMLGGLHTEEERCELYAKLGDFVVVQVDYRLAPEHPFPAAYDDCLAVFEWLGSNAGSLGIDPSRLAIGGNSAGGALTASVALAARSAELPDVVLQMLINPALDHRSATASANEFVDSPVFTRGDNLRMWDAYLPDRTGVVDERASPSLTEDLHGAPPAAIWLAEFDPLRDEGYEYAIRLMRAGVAVGLQQYTGTIHGFDGYRMTRVGRRALEDQVQAVRFAFSR